MSKIKDIEKELTSTVDLNETPPIDVIAYNELRSAADLFRLYRDEALVIDPDFQRDFVWKDADQTRFIDSLMKELPIPSMCFSLDSKLQKWQVIDGLQRISTILRFLDYEKSDWKLSKLSDIDPRIAGKSVVEVRKEHPSLFRRVENIMLPITVLRCDFSKKSHLEYIFMIFHRLNTGGLKLNNQEIRNAIFQGPFNDFLKKCNESSSWRKLVGKEEDVKDRFAQIEFILRFFAFLDNYREYEGRLASFLNDYMLSQRFNETTETKQQSFEQTIDIFYTKILDGRSATKLSKSIMEAIMFGIANNLEYLKDKTNPQIKSYYKKLINSPSLSEESLSEGIQKKEKVHARLTTAKTIFSGN